LSIGFALGSLNTIGCTLSFFCIGRHEAIIAYIFPLLADLFVPQMGQPVEKLRITSSKQAIAE
jgi:hypothetical protein